MTTQVLAPPFSGPPSPAGSIAGAAAQRLSERLASPAVTIYRFDADAASLTLLGASDGAQNGCVVGSRVPAPAGPLGAAARTGTVQRDASSYVEPDFVKNLPGKLRSQLAVPILARDGCVGVVHLEYPAPFQPEPHAEELAGATAAEVAAALGLSTAPDRPTVAGPAAALSELAHLLAHGDDAASSLQRIAETAHRTGDGEGVALLLRHGSRQMLEVAAVAGSIPVQVGELFPVHGTMAGDVMRGGQSRGGLRRGEAPVLGPRDEELGLDDVLLAPIAAAGKPLGVLLLVNRGRSADASGDAVDRLQVLATMAGAIESSRVIRILRQQISDSSTIAEVGRALTGTLGVDEVIELVVRAAEMLTNARGVALGLPSESQGLVHVACAAGVLRRSRGQAIPMQGSLMGWAMLTGEVVTTANASDDERGFPHDVRQGPAVVIPLESRGKTRGALMATRAEGAPEMSELDVDALRKLTAYATIAIDNAQLYGEQTKLTEALRAQATELERANDEVRESHERLLVSEKMAALGRLTAGIAHEINSPLGGIMNCLQLATQYAGEYKASATDPEVTAEDHLGIANDLIESLVMAEAATRKVGQFVRTIKGQTRIGDEETRIAFNAAEEINGTLSILQHELRNRHVALETDADASIELIGDPGKFALVVQNLVSNAIDAYEGADGQVKIRLSKCADGAVLEVRDDGCGIPATIRGRVFDYLFTTKDVGQGTGLGLSIVHSIITTHFQGTIDLRSEVGSGTTFVITIPTSAGGD